MPTIATISGAREPAEFIFPYHTPVVAALDEGVAAPAESGYVVVDKALQANKTHKDLKVYRERAKRNEKGWTLFHNGVVLQHECLVVPDIDYLRTKIIREVHGRITIAPPGRGKTRKLVTSLYWWPGVIGDVDIYVANCLDCRPAKSPRDKTPRLLHSIPPPLQSCRRVVMDFNIQPKNKYGYDNALVIMCPLSKTGRTVPYKKIAIGRNIAQMWYWGPYRIVGLPEEVITD